MRVLIVLLILALAVAVVVMVYRSRRIFVIGAQLAEANERERLHRARFDDGPSPLPQVRYDSSLGETTLIDPELSELDRQLRSFCSRVAASTAGERGDIRNAATSDDFYTLLDFARRASVFSLRSQDAKWIEDALTAVAVIDATRIDERDLPLTLSLVHHAAERLQRRPLELFDAAAALADARTSGIIRSFVRGAKVDKDIESSWGYQEVQGPGGAGFVRRGFEAYNPTQDLLGAGLAIRDAMKRDRYEADVMLATELPSVWFPARAREKAEAILGLSAATVSVDGTLRSHEDERADVQSFLVFVVETRTEEQAATLEALAESNRDAEPATIATHSGRLFALAVARSFEIGVASYETRESLRRFEAPIRAALQGASA